MTIEPVVQLLLFGVFVGALYGVAAIGLALVFGVMQVLNVAHGELLMLGGYLTFWLFTLWHIDPFISLVIVIPLMFLVGLALQQGLFSHVIRFDEETKIKNSLLIGFGLSLILANIAIQLWTADERSVTVAYAGIGIELFGIRFPYTRLGGLAVALLAILAIDQFLHRTLLGKSIRATAEDWEAAELVGVSARSVYLITFGLGAALAGVAGTLVSVGYTVTPNIGLTWTIKGLIVVVLAGLGNVFGVFAAGILLGLAEAISVLVVGPAYREVVGLVLFLVVLLLRPRGLFGAR